jgi:hypothetical protein
VFDIRVRTKLPNSEHSYKGKVKTHNYINRQNQSTTLCLTTPLRHLVSARNDERMNSDFFFKYFYAGIVQSNLCWKIHNKYAFHINIHICFKISRSNTNNSKFPKEVNGTATKCRVHTVHEWIKITVFVLLESK